MISCHVFNKFLIILFFLIIIKKSKSSFFFNFFSHFLIFRIASIPRVEKKMDLKKRGGGKWEKKNKKERDI
jgi:hypothetical protein